jgi:mannose-6-phosphate isomerase-like protein (cupin superfamily)
MEGTLRIIVLTAVLGTFALPGFAQNKADIVYASPDDVGVAIAHARAAKTLAAEPIVAAGPYHLSAEYRANPTPASLHEKNNELINVIDGSGTMIVGGTLLDEKRRDDSNLNGSGIEGGSSFALTKGSYVFVPAGTAHYFAAIGKDGLTITTIYIPKAQ